MQKHHAVDGVVIRVKDIGERDRYLTVLTAEHGRITLLSKGSHSVRSQQVAISQLYTYANFEYYQRESIRILKGGSSIQPFYALSADIDRLNLAAYFCDVAYELSDEGAEAGELLQLLLNSLYATSHDLRPHALLKGAFELRAAAISGYLPDLDGCASCGKEGGEATYLDVMNGALLCSQCLRERTPTLPEGQDSILQTDVLCPVTPAVRTAMHYSIHAPAQRLFAFELPDEEDRRLFARTAETYLLSHLGRSFDSLQFYHTMRRDSLSVNKGTKL